MKHKSENIYCVDTSALVTMHRFYPVKMIPDLWKLLEELFKQRKIFSHDFVYDEIVPDSDTKDDLARLISKHKVCFKTITKRQAQLVPEILSLFPHLRSLIKDQSKGVMKMINLVDGCKNTER